MRGKCHKTPDKTSINHSSAGCVRSPCSVRVNAINHCVISLEKLIYWQNRNGQKMHTPDRHVTLIGVWCENLCTCVCVSLPQKDVWILAASLPKWDTQNSSSGLTSRTHSTVNYHASVRLGSMFTHARRCVYSRPRIGSMCALMHCAPDIISASGVPHYLISLQSGWSNAWLFNKQKLLHQT